MTRNIKLICLIIAMVCCLTSCVSSSKSAEQTTEDVRARLEAASAINYSADVFVDYGERTYDFTMDYSTESGVVEVTAPEAMAGTTVTAGEQDGEMVLEFDGAELNTGGVTEDGLSPMTALPVITRQWTEGYVLESYYESSDGTDFVAVKTEISDDVICTSWFDRATGDPVKAEIASNDYVVIQCTFSDVILA